jgi:hypothetical protein
MKISYSNYPILKKLKDGTIGTIPVYETDVKYFLENWQYVSHHFDKSIKAFSNNVYKISDTFYSAFLFSHSKIAVLMRDIMERKQDNLSFSGTFIIDNSVYFIDFDSPLDKKSFKCILFRFRKDGIPASFFIQEEYDNKYTAWGSSDFGLAIKESPIDSDHPIQVVFAIVGLYLFKQYAKVETKLLPANKKIKDINCKYVNDTNSDITYLDSTWFTNLVKSDGFKVRGHFRLQPKKKDGVWTKELIWVKDFEKTGYTRLAKKLITEDDL